MKKSLVKSDNPLRWILPAFLFLALIGSLVAIFFWLGKEPEPLLVGIAVNQYDAPEWPANPYAEQDVRGFGEWFSAPFLAFERQGKSGILASLRDAREEAGVKQRALVLYVTALGTVLGDTVYLLPSDARIGTESTWLTLSDLLTPLLHVKTPTLLILDVRPAHVPLMLFPGGDVSERLHAELTALLPTIDAPLIVFSANTPSTGPAILYSHQRTLFGLATAHAVGGSADGWNPRSNKDGVVSTEEFIGQVTLATSEGSRRFGDPQFPKVYRSSSARDFPLAKLPSRGPAQFPEPLPDRVYPGLLTEAWGSLDAARNTGYDRRSHWRMRPYLQSTLRAEQRWLGGIGDAAVGQTLDPKPSLFVSEMEARKPIPPLPGAIARLNMKATLGEHGQPAAILLRKSLDAIRNPSPKLQEEIDKELPKIAAETMIPPDVIAAAVLDAAKQLDSPTQEQLRQWLRIATAAQPRKPLAELVTLELMAGLPAGRYTRRFQTEGTVRRVLESSEAAEQAGAMKPRSLPWLLAGLKEADTLRRSALVALCDPESEADAIRTAPAKLEESTRKYQALIQSAERLSRARMTLETARAVRDDLATSGLPESSWKPGEWEKSLREMVDSYSSLAMRLHDPRSESVTLPEDIGRLSDTLRDQTDALLKLATRETPPSLRTSERLLRWPSFPSTTRTRLRTELFTLSRSTTAEMLSNWPGEFKTVVVSSSVASPSVPGESIRDLRITLALLESDARLHGEDRPIVALSQSFDSRRASLTDPKEFLAMVRAVESLRSKVTLPAPDTQLEKQLAAQSRYARWLAERYEAEAAAFTGITFESGYTPAKRWREVAELCR